jgi:hypothetical protein
MATLQGDDKNAKGRESKASSIGSDLLDVILKGIPLQGSRLEF